MRCLLLHQHSGDESTNVLLGIDQQRFSSKVPFTLGAMFYDNDIFETKFHMCGRVCSFRGRRVPCFHGQCFDFRLFPLTPNFLRAFEYSAQPPASEEQRRFDRTWRLLQARLPVDLTLARLRPSWSSLSPRFLFASVLWSRPRSRWLKATDLIA